MKKIIKKYKALSQECRLRIIHLLLKAKTPLCICEMMDVLKKEQYQISRCLGILKKANLVEEEREGRLLLYSLKQTDSINNHLYKTILIEKVTEQFILDLKALEKRLALRSNGKVVVTYNS